MNDPEVNETANPASATTGIDELTKADLTAKDWALNDILDVVLGADDTADGSSFGITLYLNGTVISGTVIGRREWLTRLTDSLEPSSSEVASVLREAWTKSFDRNDLEATEREKAGLNHRPRSYIHMRDVTTYAQQMINVSTWRGSLSDVSGWNLGRLSTQTEPTA